MHRRRSPGVSVHQWRSGGRMHPSTRDWIGAGLLSVVLVTLILLIVLAGGASLPPSGA